MSLAKSLYSVMKEAVYLQLEQIGAIGTCPFRVVPYRTLRSQTDKWQRLELAARKRIQSDKFEDRILGEYWLHEREAPLTWAISLAHVAIYVTEFSVDYYGDGMWAKASLLNTTMGRALRDWLIQNDMNAGTMGLSMRYMDNLEEREIIAMDVIPIGMRDPLEDENPFYQDWLEFYQPLNDDKDLWDIGKFQS